MSSAARLGLAGGVLVLVAVVLVSIAGVERGGDPAAPAQPREGARPAGRPELDPVEEEPPPAPAIARVEAVVEHEPSVGPRGEVERPPRLAGQVLFEGEPRPECLRLVELALDVRWDGGDARANLDAAGRFETGLPPWVTAVQVSLDSDFAWTSEPLEVPVRRDLRVPVEVGGVLEVVAQPAPERFGVSLFGDGSFTDYHSRTAPDGSGRVRFARLAPRAYEVESGALDIEESSGDPEKIWAHVAVGQVTRLRFPPEVRLRTIRGLVQRSGRPVEGAEISVLRMGDGRLGWARTTTRDGGGFSVELGRAPSYRVDVEASVGGVEHHFLLTDEQAMQGPLEIDLPTGSIRGRVIRGGPPRMGRIRVHLVPLAPGDLAASLHVPPTTPDAGGSFRFDGLPPGRYAVQAAESSEVEPEGLSPFASFADAFFELDPDGAPTFVELVLPQPSALVGRIHGPGGAQEHARVYVRDAGNPTASWRLLWVPVRGGRFEAQVPAGALELVATSGMVAGPVRIEARPAARCEVELSMEPAAGVQVVAYDGKNGVRQAGTFLVHDSTGRRMDYGRPTTNLAEATFAPLPLGDYEIEFTPVGGPPVRRRVRLDREGLAELKMAVR